MKVKITLEYEKVVDFPEEQIFKEHQRQSYIAGIVFELERLERMPEWEVKVCDKEQDNPKTIVEIKIVYEKKTPKWVKEPWQAFRRAEYIAGIIEALEWLDYTHIHIRVENTNEEAIAESAF